MPDAAPTAAEKLALLGQPSDACVLIVNGDDLGMCHAANAATFEAMERGEALMCLALRRKQLELALNGDVTMLIWLGKQRLGQQ